LVAVPIKYINNDPSYVKMLGMPHGLLFVAYIVLTVLMFFNNKWVKKNLLGVLAASVIPFGTFVVDYKLKKNLNKV
jgi:integral membrane protein